MILDSRKLEGKNTLVIAEDNKIEGMELIDPFSDLETTKTEEKKNG
jgi:hypothetical protein